MLECEGCMSAISKRSKGWGVPQWISVSGAGGVNVNLDGVCSCSWRRELCDPRKQCHIIHDNGGGEEGTTHMLRRLMGRKFPRVWAGRLLWRNNKQWDLRRKALDRFASAFYKRCRPVWVGVTERK